jgi:hypothetical protein
MFGGGVHSAGDADVEITAEKPAAVGIYRVAGIGGRAVPIIGRPGLLLTQRRRCTPKI